jgi:hypothetical protein
MVFASARAAYASPTFAVQLAVNMAINFGVNFGIEWATMSEWGRKANPGAWPGISAWRFDTAANSCLALDMLLTTFSIGFLCSLLATGGVQKEVREKKCEMLAADATRGGWWAWTPVPIESFFLRSLATGAYATALLGVPSLLVAWATIGNGQMEGFTYVVFKGVWATAVAGLTYFLIFPAAINVRNFPELEFEELVELAGKDGSGPVGAGLRGGAGMWTTVL